MTRKDFQLVAKVVATIDDIRTRNTVALNFATELHKQNDRFDTVRFLSACKTEPNDEEGAQDDFSSSKENFIAP